jgi:penicillin amidase
MDVLPVEYNPERGFTGTANSMNLPDDYPIEKYPMGFEWSDSWRYDRLWQVLEAQPEHSPADSSALQRDYLSLMAVQALHNIPADISGPAVDLLRDWDGVMTADSPAAGLFAIWYYRHLRPALERELLPDAPELVSPLGSTGVLRLMTEERAHDVVAASLVTAYTEAQSVMGDDSSLWRWGTLHEIRFQHPLLHLADEELADQMRYPPYPRGGSGFTTNSTGFRAADLLVRGGASYRQVLDVGNWDAATMTNAPGQSGDPRSPYYGNLLKGWAEEEAFPLLFSREQVLAHKTITIHLSPK